MTSDGDGWFECSCGDKHWGLYGAAGLLLVRNKSILMQHRASWVHNGDTWSIPGGAKQFDETAFDAALRETTEELEIDTQTINPIEIFTDNHGTWKYETVICNVTEAFVVHKINDESQDIDWIKVKDVEKVKLHPSFANTWPQLLQRLTLATA